MNSVKSQKSQNNTCWSFSNADQVVFAVVPIKVAKDATTTNNIIQCKVDTGFNGVIGIPKEIIDSLNFIAVGSLQIQTASGMGHVSYYHGYVSIENTKFENLKAIILQTPRPIIGRSLLNLGKWLYDGPNEKWCLIP